MENDRTARRETKLREAVMKPLLHLNSSNTGMALQALHDALIMFDNYVKADFAAQDEALRRKRPKRRGKR